jgi:outer membrane lipoprotein-sorting protein
MGRKAFLVVCAAILAASAPAAAMTAEEVIAKHVEAHGGDAWDAIDSMKITGSFTAFSQVSPFTLHRKKENKYHLDSLHNNRTYIVGYDGETLWWNNEMMQQGAKKVTGGPDHAALIREVDFTTPFRGYKEKGYTAKLLGETDYEGMPAVGLELTRPDESVETWYLDPDTYLAMARTSPGSDFGRPMTQRTVFDDYREVSGVQIPYLTETQWYTRNRVMMVENVEINVAIDDAIFLLPAPTGMGPFQSMEGTWEVVLSQRPGPQADWSDSEMISTIESHLAGAMMEETFTTARGTDIIRTLSYDVFKEGYRVTEINSQSNQMDILEGTMSEDGRLTVSNLETGTPTLQGGFTIHGRTSIFNITEDGFEMEQEYTLDGGENWVHYAKSSYKRQQD